MKRLKKKQIILIVSILVIVLVAILLLCFFKKPKAFTLENKYYGKSEYLELTQEGFNKLIEDKESFLAFICQDSCIASSDFNQVLNKFLARYSIKIYKLDYADINNTILQGRIKYYPSFVIIQKGEIIESLDANSDKDTKIYQNVDEFEKWLSKYVILPERNKVEKEIGSTPKPKEANITVKLDNLKYDENKVNIYFFWGNGCPRCTEELAFFNKIRDEYGQYYTFNSFEVWNNQDNFQILKEFAAAMGDEARGVPYTIIGNEAFLGFRTADEEYMKNAIKSQYKNSYDVYFNNKK